VGAESAEEFRVEVRGEPYKAFKAYKKGHTRRKRL
jgi:hypothetical protein